MIAKPNPELRTLARPLRVAFIIEDADGAHHFLDSAFSESFSRHGGRQSLVVPVVGETISTSYLGWLKRYDPDVVFTAVAAAQDSVIELIEKHSNPSTILAIRQDPDEAQYRARGFRLREAGLTSLSWLPFLKVSSGGVRARPEFILDAYPRWTDDGLVTDNFGTLVMSCDRFPLHKALSDIVKPLILTPVDAPVDRWRSGISGEEITSGYDVLTRLVKSGSVLTLAYLANLYSTQISIHSHEWTRSFCLIVGDSFTDRVTCWNAGLLFDDAQQQAYKTLRLPASCISDPNKVEQVKTFLNNQNWITGYSGNAPRVTIRTSSIDSEQIEAFGRALRGERSWCIYDTRRIESIDDVCPAPNNIANASLVRGNSITRTPLRHESESIPVPQPLQLRHSSLAHPICSEGTWISQLSVDRSSDNSKFANVRDSWILPRRNQLARLFLGNLAARITTEGQLAIPVNRGIELLDITDPNDDALFHSLLHEQPTYVYPDVRHQRSLRSAYVFSKPSDNGRYLIGLLGMLKSLSRAYEVLGRGFWNRQVMRMASPAEDEYPRLIGTLKKRFAPQAGKFVLEREDQWESLARTVVRQAAGLRKPTQTVTLQRLQDDWIQELSGVIDAHEQLHSHREEMMAEASKELNESLQRLCGEGVFHQGYEWLCPRCSYRNWSAIDCLGSTLSCQICRHVRAPPVDLKFQFRLNEFLGSCVRDHDTLSVVWALGAVRDEYHHSSFVFAPQTALYRAYPENRDTPPDREIDVLAVVDGRVLVGEVKASLSEIGQRELDDLATFTREISADIVLLGSLEGDDAAMGSKIAALRQRVGTDVEVKGMLRNEDVRGRNHYLS